MRVNWQAGDMQPYAVINPSTTVLFERLISQDEQSAAVAVLAVRE